MSYGGILRSAMKIHKLLFQDNTGKYIVGQPPNIPVYLIIGSFLLSQLTQHLPIHRLFETTLSGSIFLWSYLEITYGESLFRRILGGLVMLLLLGRSISNI